MKSSAKTRFLAAAALGVLTHSVHASLVFNLGSVITGDSPSGTAPWLRATFTQVDSTHVDLLLETLHLTGNENVKDWAFNLNPALNVASLSAEETSRVGSFKPESVILSDKVSGYGGFKFDFDFDFDEGGDTALTFSQGDSVTMRLYRESGLSISDFNYAVTHDGRAFYTGAHVQNTPGPQKSGHVGAVVPEPSTYFAAALLGIPGIFALGKALPRRGKEKQQ